jgi:hypothetical protein
VPRKDEQKVLRRCIMVILRTIVVSLLFSILLIGCTVPLIDIKITEGGSAVSHSSPGGGCQRPLSCPPGTGAAPRTIKGKVAEKAVVNLPEGRAIRYYFINNVEGYREDAIFQFEVPPGVEMSDQSIIQVGKTVVIDTVGETIEISE